MKSFSATLNLETGQLPKHYVGNALPFSQTPQEKRLLAGLNLMRSLGWVMLGHIYILMRVLALSNTRFAMDTKKLYLQRILRWNDLS